MNVTPSLLMWRICKGVLFSRKKISGVVNEESKGNKQTTTAAKLARERSNKWAFAEITSI